MNTQELAFTVGAVAIGGAALYLIFRGVKGTASDVVGVGGSLVAGVVEGAGGAFQDVAQAAFGVPKTDADECATALAAGDKWTASYKCPASEFIGSLFSKPKPQPKPQPKPSGQVTAPGGGIIEAPGCDLFKNPEACYPMPGVLQYDPIQDWQLDFAPANPVPFKVVTVAGLRG